LHYVVHYLHRIDVGLSKITRHQRHIGVFRGFFAVYQAKQSVIAFDQLRDIGVDQLDLAHLQQAAAGWGDRYGAVLTDADRPEIGNDQRATLAVDLAALAQQAALVVDFQVARTGVGLIAIGIEHGNEAYATDTHIQLATGGFQPSRREVCPGGLGLAQKSGFKAAALDLITFRLLEVPAEARRADVRQLVGVHALRREGMQRAGHGGVDIAFLGLPYRVLIRT